MVHTHDPIVNLRADIKASMQALDSYVRMGGFRRAASLARELGHKLEQLADWEQPNDQTRTRVVEPPPSPRTAEEFLGPDLAAVRQANRQRRAQEQVSRFSTGVRKPKRKHYEITELPRPELPEGQP